LTLPMIPAVTVAIVPAVLYKTEETVFAWSICTKHLTSQTKSSSVHYCWFAWADLYTKNILS